MSYRRHSGAQRGAATLLLGGRGGTRHPTSFTAMQCLIIINMVVTETATQAAAARGNVRWWQTWATNSTLRAACARGAQTEDTVVVVVVLLGKRLATHLLSLYRSNYLLRRFSPEKGEKAS